MHAAAACHFILWKMFVDLLWNGTNVGRQEDSRLLSHESNLSHTIHHMSESDLAHKNA